MCILAVAIDILQRSRLVSSGDPVGMSGPIGTSIGLGAVRRQEFCNSTAWRSPRVEARVRRRSSSVSVIRRRRQSKLHAVASRTALQAKALPGRLAIIEAGIAVRAERGSLELVLSVAVRQSSTCLTTPARRSARIDRLELEASAEGICQGLVTRSPPCSPRSCPRASTRSASTRSMFWIASDRGARRRVRAAAPRAADVVPQGVRAAAGDPAAARAGLLGGDAPRGRGRREPPERPVLLGQGRATSRICPSS